MVANIHCWGRGNSFINAINTLACRSNILYFHFCSTVTCFSHCVGPMPPNLCSITRKVHKCAIPNVWNKINSGIQKQYILLFRICNMWCDDAGMQACAHTHKHQVSCKMGFHLVYIKLNNIIYYVLFSYVNHGFLFKTNEDHDKIRDGKP